MNCLSLSSKVIYHLTLHHHTPIVCLSSVTTLINCSDCMLYTSVCSNNPLHTHWPNLRAQGSCISYRLVNIQYIDHFSLLMYGFIIQQVTVYSGRRQSHADSLSCAILTVSTRANAGYTWLWIAFYSTMPTILFYFKLHDVPKLS